VIGIITEWVIYISLPTPCSDPAKKKEGLDLVVLTLSNADAQQGPSATQGQACARCSAYGLQLRSTRQQQEA